MNLFLLFLPVIGLIIVAIILKVTDYYYPLVVPKKQKQFVVEGGIFTDTKFVQIVDGSEEHYGPFDNYQSAYDIWKANMWLNVDNALHRLYIKEK